MTRRLAVVAAAAVAIGALLLALADRWGVFDPPAPNPAVKPAPIGAAGWKEKRRYSVNRVAVIEGESTHPERAAEIARDLMEPISAGYDEVLIYVRAPGTRAPTWRVQWTKATGYRVLHY